MANAAAHVETRRMRRWGLEYCVLSHQFCVPSTNKNELWRHRRAEGECMDATARRRHIM